MTPISQHIALMESLGWEEVREYVFDLYGSPAVGGFPRIDGSLGDEIEQVSTLSLDLMAQAESTLSDKTAGDEYSRYCIELNRIACRIQCGNTHTCGYTISATKEQRLEAYLRTTGRYVS